MRDRMLEALARGVTQHPRRVLAAAAALTLVSFFGLARLDVLTSRAALYPADVPVNQRFEAFLDDFGTPSNLIVVLDGPSEALGPFSEELAAELKARPELIRDVFYKLDLDFFREHGFLFLPLPELRRVHQEVIAHPDEVAAFNELNGLMPLLAAFTEASGPEVRDGEAIDLDTARQLVAVGRELFAEWLRWIRDAEADDIQILERLFVSELSSRRQSNVDGYLRSDDDGLQFLFVQPTQPSEEFEVVSRLTAATRAAAAQVRARWVEAGRVPPEVGLTGIPANVVDEVSAIRHDVVVTAGLAAAGVLLVVLLGFRSLRRAALVFLPLVLASIWNLGLTWLVLGHLTLVTSAFTAILFGLGIDYAIFLTTRVEEEMRRGVRRTEAIVTAVRRAGRTLLTAGGTTMLAFFVIGMVEFKGFAELGIVAGCGVALVLVAALVVLPAALTLLAPPPRARATQGARPVTPTSRAAGRARPALITLIALGLAGVSIGQAWDIPFDGDVMGLLPSGSESARYQREMSSRSSYSPEFLAVMAPSVRAVRALAPRLAALPTVARVDSIADMLPADQEDKVVLMRGLAPVLDRVLVPRAGFEACSAQAVSERLEEVLEGVEDAQEKAFSAGKKRIVADLEGLIEGLSELIEALEADPGAMARTRAFERALFALVGDTVDQLRRWTRVAPLTPDDLPRGLLDRFRGASGHFVIYVFPEASIYDEAFLARFTDEVYAIAPEATGFPSTHRVFSRMAVDGFRDATIYAALVVLLALAFDLRRPRSVLLAALPLALGAAWMFGLMAITGASFNYANIVALPLVLGLAVDYGVFITYRLREDEARPPAEVMRVAARPVAMAAITTMAGIGALVWGAHQGIASLGQVLLMGIAACLLAALIVLPSVATLTRRARPDEED